MKRHHVLGSSGPLLVNTDLHGNREDFERLEAVFRDLGPGAHWVILGDIVHGPDPASGASQPALYGYPDDGPWLIERVHALLDAHPERVFFVLGNHEHGHAGGVHTAKFHDDEVRHLEARLGPVGTASLQRLIDRALFGVAAPCGVLLAHGSPDATLQRLDELDALDLKGNGHTREQQLVMASFLRAYGQPRDRTEALLAQLRASSGLDLRVVVHGHDRSEDGLFYEGGNQVCPVIFGAYREHKRYVCLDLAAHYPSAEALRDGHEILRLYPSFSP